MKKSIITLLLILTTALSATAWQEIKLDDDISITNVTNVGNIKRITVKMLDSDGVMSEVNKKKISHELSFWGIKCDSKESRYYGSETYDVNNQIIDKYSLDFDIWLKIDNSEDQKFAQILYNNVCK